HAYSCSAERQYRVPMKYPPRRLAANIQTKTGHGASPMKDPRDIPKAMTPPQPNTQRFQMYRVRPTCLVLLHSNNSLHLPTRARSPRQFGHSETSSPGSRVPQPLQRSVVLSVAMVVELLILRISE